MQKDRNLGWGKGVYFQGEERGREDNIVAIYEKICLEVTAGKLSPQGRGESPIVWEISVQIDGPWRTYLAEQSYTSSRDSAKFGPESYTQSLMSVCCQMGKPRHKERGSGLPVAIQ